MLGQLFRIKSLGTSIQPSIVAKDGGFDVLTPYMGNVRHAYLVAEAANDLAPKSKPDTTLNDEGFGQFDTFTGHSIHGVDVYGYTYDPLLYTLTQEVYTLYTYRLRTGDFTIWDLSDDAQIEDDHLSVDTFMLHSTGDTYDDGAGRKTELGQKGPSAIPKPVGPKSTWTSHTPRDSGCPPDDATVTLTDDHEQKKENDTKISGP